MAFSVLSVVVIALLLHSERFHNYLLRAAQQKATEVLGSQAQMRDFAIHWTGISPTVDLYGIVIHGAAPYSDPPLLQADALHVGLTVTSLLHKAWYVSDVRIERPVVRIFADRDGRTNLPSPPQAKENKSPQSINIFDLGIRHLLLERGEIYYNDRKSDLSADLHDLSLQSGFEILKQELLRDAFISRRTSSASKRQVDRAQFQCAFCRNFRRVQAGKCRAQNWELAPGFCRQPP